MDLLTLLQAEHSKAQMQKIVDWIGNDQQRFDNLVKIFLTGEYRIIQRAAWPLSQCAKKYPALVNKHYKSLLQQMQDPKQHPAVKRNVLRIFDNIEIPQKYHGRLMTLCMDYIADPKEPIAVQAFALGVLKKLATFYPEIRPEVEIIIASRLPNATAAYCSRARAFLKN